jgi:hypothetical protein
MDPLSQAISDLAAGKKKKEFSMADYEAIPVENRQDYVKSTQMSYKNQPKKHEQINVEGQLKAAEPVSPKVDQIKAMLGQAPQPEAPMQPMTQTVKAMSNEDRPVSELDTLRDIRSEASRGVAGGLTDFWPALVPLAVEALVGRGQGQSLDVSSKYIMDKVGEDKKDAQKLEDRLFELKKARAKSGAKGDSKLYEAVDSQGNPIWMTREQAIGSGLIPKGSAADGKDERARLAREQQKQFADRNYARNVVNDLNKDLDFKTAKSRYSATNDAINVLNQKNWAGDAGVGFLFAKGIFGEVGSLTNEERQAFIADPYWGNKFNTLFEKYLKEGSGSFTPTDRSDLQKLASIMRDKAISDMGLVANNYREAHLASGLDVNPYIQPLLKRNDIAPKYITAEKAPSQPTQSMNRAIKPLISPAKVRVVSPEGVTGTIPLENLQKALSEGYKRL